MSMRLAMGWDHAGLRLGQVLAAYLTGKGYTVLDLGTKTTDSVDYTDFASAVAQAILRQEATLGILVCGTGIGMSISANKVPGIRAALCFESTMAQLSRSHNDAHILCMGERIVGESLALSMVDAFLNTPFTGGRHQRRIDKISQLDQAAGRPCTPSC
jgi:ribose 5-phosphate isomerase B